MAGFSKKAPQCQPKFKVGSCVRLEDTKSTDPIYKVLSLEKVKGAGHFNYCIQNVKDFSDTRFETCYGLKNWDDVCPREVFGNSLVGKVVKEVTYTHSLLSLVFEDETEADFYVEGDGYSSLEHEGLNDN